MKAFVTGGTGFIGSRIVQKLIARGDQVSALARSDKSAAALQAAGAQPIPGDLYDLNALREGMAGCDLVFHLAAWYKLGARDQSQAEKINVQGTSNVLGLAWELGVPRILYTSTVAVFGDTHGKLVDESYQKTDDRHLTEYDRTKWKAHYEVALPLIQKGAPIIIAMPGVVFGPGDASLISQIMHAFYHGLLAFFPGPETVLSYGHVDDIAEAHVLLADKGRIGESYIVSGPALPFRQIAGMWAKASGKRAPLAYVPAAWLKPLTPLARLVGKIMPMPEMLSPDGIQVLGATYSAHAGKIKQELGWEPRPLEQGFQETFAALDQVHHPARKVKAADQRG